MHFAKFDPQIELIGIMGILKIFAETVYITRCKRNETCTCTFSLLMMTSLIFMNIYLHSTFLTFVIITENFSYFQRSHLHTLLNSGHGVDTLPSILKLRPNLPSGWA